MDTFFPELSPGPAGFSYFPEFLSVTEEQELLAYIGKTELRALYFQGYEALRKVASFGMDYSFDKRSLTKGRIIPVAFQPLISKVAQKLDIKADALAEMLITEYPVGAVINWHRDAPPFDIIAGISLMSPCNFKFRPYDEVKRDRKSVRAYLVQPRSMYVIKGEARTKWQHSTSPVKRVRYSITLRTLVKQQ